MQCYNSTGKNSAYMKFISVPRENCLRESVDVFMKMLEQDLNIRNVLKKVAKSDVHGW